MQFRPTLIIGLGGSGTFVVRRLKKRLRRVIHGPIPPSIQLLAFDTDAQKTDDSLESLTDAEFHRLSNFNGSEYVTPEARRANPPIDEFWQYRKLVPDFISDGAKQRPPIGRLAFFVHFEKVRQQLAGAIERTFRSAPGYVPPPNIGAVDTYVIGSSCGGTGAGMYFDVALLARTLTRDAGREAIMQAHVFLPNCFSGTQAEMKSIQTNSCAFLRTMETLQSEPLPRISYPAFKTAEQSAPLFRRVHLLSSVDVTGIRAADVQEVFENVALQLDLEVTGASARDMRSAIDNAEPAFHDRPLGRLAIYSSYGAAMLSGSSDLGLHSVLPTFSEQVKLALLQPSTAKSPEIVNSALSRLDGVLSDDEPALEVSSAYNMEVVRITNTNDPAEAVRQLQRHLQQVGNGVSLSFLNELAELKTTIRHQLRDLLVRGDNGIEAALAHVTTLHGAISKLLARLDEPEAGQRGSIEALVSKVEGFFTSRKEGLRILQTEGHQLLKTETLLSVRGAVKRKARPTVAELLNQLTEWLGYLKQFSASGEAFVEHVERHSAAHIAAHSVISGTKSIPDDVVAIKERFARDPRDLVVRFFADPVGRGALSDLADAILSGRTTDVWAAPLRRAAEDFLKGALAESVTVGSGWAEKAALTIRDCQPMVQLATGPLHYGKKPARFVAARAYDAENVRAELRTLAPDLMATIEDVQEPGALEVTSMVLNFALYQMHESTQIEEGYRSFASKHTEPVENRYAWRAPKELWEKISGHSLLPLSSREQALARVLALYPPAPDRPLAEATSQGYRLDDEHVASPDDPTQYGMYDALNRILLSRGKSEWLLRRWRNGREGNPRMILTDLQLKTEERLATARTLLDQPRGSSFVSLLEEDLEAIKHELSGLPV